MFSSVRRSCLDPLLLELLYFFKISAKLLLLFLQTLQPAALQQLYNNWPSVFSEVDLFIHYDFYSAFLHTLTFTSTLSSCSAAGWWQHAVWKMSYSLKHTIQHKWILSEESAFRISHSDKNNNNVFTGGVSAWTWWDLNICGWHHCPCLFSACANYSVFITDTLLAT